MPQLFDELTLRKVTFRNRVGVSPMCQYSAGDDGRATDWHLAHLASRAAGGAGLVITEATAVEARGRISPQDLGLWEDAQIEPLARVVRAIEAQGAVAGIQIAHAGRKAGVQAPWMGGAPLSGAEAWPVVGPSPTPFAPHFPVPQELSLSELQEVRRAFQYAARRAQTADFHYLEIHAAHGYLLHSFLSPLSNQRSDAYGGSFENRIRFPLEVTRAVREVWPTDRVLALRISATDWTLGGWTPEETVELARRLAREGLDLLDCSSGGNVPAADIPLAPGYQVGFAQAVKAATKLATAAVGLIAEPAHANQIVESGAADIVLLGRELLRNPYWPLTAARALHRNAPIPQQYLRAFA